MPREDEWSGANQRVEFWGPPPASSSRGVDLHVRVPVVVVPYVAALLEQGIRFVEQEDPLVLLDRSDPHVLL